MIRMKQIMKRAHELARKMEGDYAARLALALRQAWREARQPKELPSEVTFKFDTGKQVETIRLKLNRWTKYGKDRIYVNERSEEHTSELQSRENLVCRLLLEKKKKQ